MSSSLATTWVFFYGSTTIPTSCFSSTFGVALSELRWGEKIVEWLALRLGGAKFVFRRGVIDLVPNVLIVVSNFSLDLDRGGWPNKTGF